MTTTQPDIDPTYNFACPVCATTMGYQGLDLEAGRYPVLDVECRNCGFIGSRAPGGSSLQDQADIYREDNELDELAVLAEEGILRRPCPRCGDAIEEITAKPGNDDDHTAAFLELRCRRGHVLTW